MTANTHLPDALPPGSSGLVTIDLGALRDNWRSLRDLVAPAECAAVVKADAYGLGAARVIPALVTAGCRSFFVATADEAEQARALAPDATLYVLSGLIHAGGGSFGNVAGFAVAARRLAAIGATPIMPGLDALHAWHDEATRSARRLPVGIQIETGLNRLGWHIQDPIHPSYFANLDLQLVMSHLACADEPDHPMNAAQLAAFNTARDRLRQKHANVEHGEDDGEARMIAAPMSLAASDGLMLGPQYHFDLVRPGYALYGGQASRGRRAPVNPVVTVHARILQERWFDGGESVGYGAAYTAPPGFRAVATVAAGYADGIPRAAGSDGGSGGGFVALGGVRCPIVGRVSMDLITVDVTAASRALDRVIVPGDLVEIIGPNVPLEAAGQAAGTIGYEILTRLGRRFHRHYLG